MAKNAGTHDFKSEHEKERSAGGSSPGGHSTESARGVSTKRVQSAQIEKDLGRGCGNRAPFGRHKASK